MGSIHALHLHELCTENTNCEFAAIAELDSERARRFLAETRRSVPVFSSVDELARARVADATIVVTPTDKHHEHAAQLIEFGQRVLLEKPLTGSLESDRKFSEQLDREHPNSLMLAFQRRFDEPLQYAKQLIDQNVIGRVFKVYSALEDSNPAPNGYRSGGILPDMAIHNADEVLWLTGAKPSRALAIGSRLYSHALTTSEEDFDDALLYLWLDNGSVAQIQVSRNHVSGYRNEAIIFGENGQIHVGHFEQTPREVFVEAYGRRDAGEPIAATVFPMREYGRPLPEFADRFGPAYKRELATFIDCCASGAPFPTTHRDGLYAQEVISAGMRGMLGFDNAACTQLSAAAS
jgi:myo-inositol 2-dehydrogenase/D-chiro-inositol 1-dehydrogenase